VKLFELKSILREAGNRHFQLQLPSGAAVPQSFHVTEVGRVQKTFIDCGGVLRTSDACQLQVWIGPDVDHRIEAGKAAKILEKASSFLPDESISVEIEYEDEVISQYTIEGCDRDDEAVVLRLARKHTDCLARHLCGVPASDGDEAKPEAACCGAGCCS
jgi:hypothetical protein